MRWRRSAAFGCARKRDGTEATMGEHKVTLHSNNVTVYGPTFHKDLPVPLMAHVELSVKVAHPPGTGSTHALTSNVMHQKKRIAQDGHDCGPDIIHVPIS